MQKNKPRLGFSLIEISIVLVVIGIIVGGVLSSSRLVNSMLISTAREATEDTSLNYMRRDVIAWFDTTSEKSFIDAEAQDLTAVSNWYETKPITTIPAVAIQNTLANQPTYAAKAINGLPGLKFDGVDDFLSITSTNYVNASAPPYTNNFSVFLVAQTTADITNNAESTSGTAGQSGQKYALFPASGDAIYPTISGTAGSGISFGLNGVGFYENSTGYTPPIMSSNSGYSAPTAVLMEYRNRSPKLYVNGKLVRSGLTSNKTSIFPPFYIGGAPSPWNNYGNFSGVIGEIIIIDRYLTAEERNDIFAYLKKKWKLNY